MPVQIDLLSLFIAVLLLIIVIFLVPMMVQLKTTSLRVDEFLRETQRDLMPMLKELREASEKLNRASSQVEESAAKAAMLADSLEGVGESIQGVNDFLRHDVGRYAGNMAGIWLGFRSASKVLIKQLLKEKKGGD